MDTNYLKEAFKSLSLLENDFDLSVDKDKVDELRSFVADDIDAIPEEPIIDTNAEEEHELQDNYVGKVILECECCHSRIYKEESDVIIDEESGLANIDEECPVCNNTLGYSVIGKIEPFDKEREIKPEEGEEAGELPDEEAEEIPEEEVTDDIEVKESLSLNDRVARKHLREEKVCPKCGKSPCVCEDCSKEKLDEELNKEELKKDVYDALAAVAYDYEVNKGEAISRKDFEEAEEYFNNFFAYESEEDFDEALDTSDSLRADVYHALSEIGYRYFKKGIDVTEDDFKWAIDRFLDGYFHSMTQDDFEDMQMQMSPEDTVKDESLNEGIENLSLDTEDTHMEMTSDETGKVTVTTEPITEEEVTDEVEDSIVDEPLDAEAGPEEIVPLDQEEMTDIEANSQEEEEQQLDAESEETIDQEPEVELTDEETEVEEETPDEEIEEFDEESFDEMGESFLRKVYSNVDKFSTTDATYNNGSLIVEGNIRFNSGKEKKTQFIFENRKVTKRGRTMLEGYNTTFSKNLKAFKLKGTLSEGKFTPESLFYNFKVNQLNEATNSNEVIKVCGKAKSSH